jgi:hypothetical protein
MSTWRRVVLSVTGLTVAIVPSMIVTAGSAVAERPTSGGDPTTLAVIGDIPYGGTQVANFPYVVGQINDDPEVEWVSHLGDIKSGSSVCSDEYFDWVRSEFDRFDDPLVYTPGDNEWTDCHRPNNGGYDPYERLAAIRETFFPVPGSTLGLAPMSVIDQRSRGFVENVRFGAGGAAFAALHVVGSNNGLAPWTGNTEPTAEQRSEVDRRTRATLLLINQTFAAARRSHSGVVVLMMQADMFDPTVVDPTIDDYSAFAPIVRRIAEQSADFSGRVLLLDGDSHTWNEDRPLAAGSSWLEFYGVRAADNLTRITVEGSTGVDEYLRLTVDGANWSYERVPLAPTPVTSVKVNEVESQNGDPGDWVELANLSDVDLDVSGFVIKDDDDTHVAVIPDGSIVPARGVLVIEEDVLGFGLGGTDLARFFAPDGTLLDTASWAGHAATTWGRCPDGTGSFQVTTSSTKGAANDCAALIGINEVESSGGDPGDWVELYNPGPSPSNVSGWTFADSDDTHVYEFPTGTVVEAGGYLVLDEATFDFGLGGGDSARLFRADGSLHDSYAWTSHASTTYGRCPNWVGGFAVTSAPTKGAPNVCGAQVESVKVNEVESSGGAPGDWVELFNVGPDAVDVSGWSFLDGDDTHVPYVIPVGTTIAAGGFLVLDEAQFVWGLGSGDTARLFRPDGSLADSYTWTSHAGTTYGRCPDGSGPMLATDGATKGAVNDCPLPDLVLNEVESNGGSPDDWVELLNPTEGPIDLSGWTVLDNDDSHVPYGVPAGTIVGPGGYVILENFGWGLGSADSVRISDPSGALVIVWSWTAHATTTYGRCPDGVGELTTTLASTKGGPNECGSPIVLNEVESSDAAGGADFVELHNPTNAATDISGYTFSDNDDTHDYVFPAGTVVPSLGYLVVTDAVAGFGLGGADSARLFDAAGALVDSYEWSVHAVQTYGRCPDATGVFEDTVEPTPGGQNHCVGLPYFDAWPGGAEVVLADDATTFTGNLSGLSYEPSGSAAPGVLWASQNGPGSLHRLVWNGSTWAPDPADGWGTGKALHYPDGTGDVDAEGVTVLDAARVYVGSERNNGDSGVSRNSVLLYDTVAAGAAPSLTATTEWNLTGLLPATGANTGIEAVEFVPDSFLTANGFVDQAAGGPYDPTAYPDHGDGLFFVGLEATGGIYAVELDHVDGTATLIATIDSGFPGVMALEFDAELGDLWAVCDDGCQGRSSILRLVGGSFTVASSFDRPSTMPNINNEGFAIAPLAACTADLRPAFWADDSDTAGNSLRQGTVSCLPI